MKMVGVGTTANLKSSTKLSWLL